MIDVVMTATYRPELIERTLSSFFKNLFSDHKENLRLVINIDPVGSNKNKTPEIKEIISKYFKNILVICPNKPNFPKAFHTVWENCSSEYVFYLEEDWELLQKLDFNQMIAIMKDNNHLAHLRLNIFKSNERETKCWKFFVPKNGRFYECSTEQSMEIGWCGHPSINRLSFMKEVIKRIDSKLNPEKQIKGRFIGDILALWRFGIYAPNFNPSIKDIGREWMIKNGWSKKGNKAWFIEWQKELPSEN
jgi:hypothetical protein